MVGFPEKSELYVGGGGEDEVGLYSNATQNVVHGPVHQHCLRTC